MLFEKIQKNPADAYLPGIPQTKISILAHVLNIYTIMFQRLQ